MSRRKSKDYEDEYEYEEEDDYEDEDYEDDYPARNPLKPFVVVLVVLLLLLAAIIGLLYFRLQAANTKVEELSANLTTAQTEINNLLSERTAAAAAAAAATPAPTAAPTPEPPAQPETTPEPLITPEPTETPEPTPAPTPRSEYIGISTSATINVTKNPQPVTVKAGGNATFTVAADNATWWAWRFVSPDGIDEVIFDVVGQTFNGVTCTGGHTTTLTVNNIPAEMNGWKAVCLLWDAAGGLKASEGGTITVEG